MANLSPSAANVKPALISDIIKQVTVGEAVVHGDVGRLDASDQKHYLADATTEENARATGFFLSSAAAGEIALYVEGSIDLGAILTVGTAYFLSATPGKICPESDLVTGNYKTLLGIASTTRVLPKNFIVSGVTVP